MKSGLIRDFQIAGRIVHGTFDFTGRSRRTEAAIYLFVVWLCILIIGLFSWLTGVSSLVKTSDWLELAVQVVVFAPLVAWAVRRAHDAGGTALYCLPLFAMIAARWLNLPDLAHSVIGGLIFIQVIILFLASPDEGPNRFGPNPRQGEQTARLP